MASEAGTGISEAVSIGVPSVTESAIRRQSTLIKSFNRKVSLMDVPVSDGENTLKSFRRRSTLKAVSHSITNMLKLRRQTLTQSDACQPKIKYENTYRLSPDRGSHFPVSRVAEIAEEVLREMIADHEYNSFLAGEIACKASTKIKNRVKLMNIPRFRIICQVIVTEKKDQGLETASRCLWNDKTDNHTSVTYTNASVAAVALIHSVYLD